MNKWVLLTIGILLGIGTIYFIINKEQTSPQSYVESRERIDSINNKVDTIYLIKDSIYKQIDTIYKKLEANNIQYEKDIKSIVSNNNDEDYLFFIEYVNRNSVRLDSICTNVVH